MNRRKPSDVWPSRRRANRIVLASFIVATVLQVSFQYLSNTFLLVDGWPVKIIVGLMLSSGIAVLFWIGGMIWSLRYGEWLALSVLCVLTVFSGTLVYHVMLPIDYLQQVETNAKTFHLVEVWKSQLDPAPNATFQLELIACEGNSRRLRDCQLLWSESAWGSTSNNYATSYWTDTYLELDNETGIVRVIAGYETASLLQQKIFVSTNLLYEYQLE